VLCAQGVGCAEVLRPPAQLPFGLDVVSGPGSFAAAVEQAVAIQRAGTHRLSDPRAQLGYDPSVDVHVRELLALARGLDGGAVSRP
jgi:hypothetical protein